MSTSDVESWRVRRRDERFRAVDANTLALLAQDETADGVRSNCNALIARVRGA